MRVAFQNKAFEEGPVQVVTFAFLNSQAVVINLWAQLPVDLVSNTMTPEWRCGSLVVADKNELLCFFCQRGQNVALQNLAGFFYQQYSW